MDGRVSSFFADMLSVLQGGPSARERAQSVLEFIVRERSPSTILQLPYVTVLSPIQAPASIRDKMGFEQHIINAIRVVGFKRLAFLDE